ncbi:MAG: sugar-binding domain-containing protein [Candidatus Latescibacterota bacterium]|jgi:beta-galactosidase/beta-glucuronidase
MSLPRPEHPRPQFQRSRWTSLNGPWRCAFDFGLSGDQRDWHLGLPAASPSILVPFCPESRLSSLGHTDHLPAIWYQRDFAVPEAWAGQRVLLHFGAVDYDCRAWVNGRPVGRHCGGSASFRFDVTAALQSGENRLVVCALDETRSGLQPRGKQSPRYASHGCLYTRTTGIWQNVWLEAVPASRIDRVRIVPDLDGGRFIVTPVFSGAVRGQRFRATLLDGDRPLTTVQGEAVSGGALSLTAASPRAWSPVDPYLYGVRLELLEGEQVVDEVESYAGLRQFRIEGNRFYLNHQPVFLRFVLDQGFYPEGIWTAPSDAELRADVERSLAVGFNGARLHQKVFEERFHYWADRLGYLTWGEYCDWGMDFALPQAVRNQQREWREVVGRDANHPSILAWTPFNETAGHAQADPERHRRVIQETCDLTRDLDPPRPINDASGYVHVDTDLFTVHDYDQNPQTFAQRYAAVDPGKPEQAFVCVPERSVPYAGQPYVVDEYGGTWWVEPGDRSGADQEGGWGYGNRPASIEEVYQRIEGLTAVLTGHPQIAGYTYTQLTDVEQERNGIYTYDRRPKFDAARLRRAFGAPAAIEKD